MFEKVINSIAERVNEHIDAQKSQHKEFAKQFNDPIALKVEWHPIGGAANFRTRVLVSEEKGLEYKASSGSYGFLFIFLLFPLLAFLLFGMVGGLSGEILMILICVVIPFCLVGAGLLHFFSIGKMIFFDLELRTFNQGRSENLTSTSFDEIYALQIIKKRERLSSSSSSRHSSRSVRYYDCYEFNLVLANGERIAVISHADREAIEKESRQIAEVLSVPVWWKEN